MQWNAVIEGTAAGVVGSILFGILVLGREHLRTWRFKKKIRQQLESVGCGSSIAGVTADVRNLTSSDFTVREVAMLTDKGTYIFNATGEISSAVPPKPQKETRETLNRLAHGEAVEAGPARVHYRTLNLSIGDGAFVVVRPFTSHRFILPAESVAGTDAAPTCLRITVDYKVAGGVQVAQVTTKGYAVERLPSALNAFRAEKLEGLNALRTQFGLSAVPPRGGTL